MNFKELLEGAEPKMPGAPNGIKIMTPQQFVAKSGDSKPEEEPEEEINEFAPYDHNDDDGEYDDEGDDELRSLYDTKFELEAELDYADEEDREHLESELEDVHARILELKPDAILEQGVAEGVDIGQEWMSDTELDQYVPQQLQQQWRELLGYDRNGNPSALWANLTGGYEPDVNDPQHRALMVKVANKWFAAKKIPNVKFFNVKDADDELEWLVQIGKQSVAEDAHGSEAFQDIVQRANGDVRGIYKELQERGLHSEIKEFCLWARHQGIADINDAMKLAYKVDLPADEENEIAGEGYFQVKELLGLGRKGVAEGFLNEASSDEAWELVGQPVPEIQQFVKQMGYGNDEQSVAKITPIIDKATATQIPAASIPKLKNLANKGNDAQTLKSILQISGRPDAEQQYTKLMQARDAGEGRNRDVSGYIQYVKSGNYDPPVLLKLPTGLYVVGGRTRLYAALALGVPANVKIISANNFKQGVAEGQEHLDRIRKLSGLDEATKLPAQTRDLGSQEFQDYMNRIVGTPDLDKSGNVKVDKKGNEKYVSGKTKGDKYKMPYIHRSSVVTYLSPDGKTYDEDAVKKTLAIRPKSLLKQNEKMKHSNGEFEQFFNVGFAALVGIALDEQTNNLIVVNTCPGAGSCKVECFAMKGGKIQFKAAWQSDGRILTYLLNDPDGFFNQLSSEISAEASAGAKGDKKFPDGWQTTVRWHDAGDFFSPEYLDMALKMAAKHPDVKFYAYTKMAGAALAKKPDNFIINWSEGANTAQEKQIKAQDPNLDKTKNSRIVPEKLFYDLLAKDEKGNLKKTDDGAWQPADEAALKEMKQRIATEYGISASSILSYTEYMAKRNSIPAGMKYNVIVAPGEGDVSANDPGVLSTLLLRH